MVAAVFQGLFLSGCKPWYSSNQRGVSRSTNLRFAPARLTPDSLVLEVGVAQIEPVDSDWFETWWTRLDQQSVPLELRKRWDRNGLRLAVVTPSGIAELRKKISPASAKNPAVDEMEEGEAESERQPLSGFFRLEAKTFRADQPREVSVAPVRGAASWSMVDSEGLTYGFGENVACLMLVTASNLSSGNAQIRLAPRLKFGPTTYVTQAWQRAFEVDVSHQENRLHQLDVDIPLRLGQAIVVSCTPNTTDMGALFFGDPFEQAELGPPQGRRILIIRLTQTQSDDLFH
ncbi:MAG TPA: hypothetical protein PKD54_12190 [Pirellulaceae bacterium]|nr:hypothetical protein [Pirellulaceae bacterium]